MRLDRWQLDEIVISDRLRKQVQEDAVVAMMDSIQRIGLQEPPTIRIGQDWDEDGGEYPILVTGLHRLEACKRLGLLHLDFKLFEGNETEARKWEIAENLHRAELTVQERAEHFAEWLRLTEEGQAVLSQVETKPQGGRPESGIRAAARELNIDKNEAYRAVKIASIVPEAREAAAAAGLANNQTALLTVAKASPEQQVMTVAEILKTASRIKAERAEAKRERAEAKRACHQPTVGAQPSDDTCTITDLEGLAASGRRFGCIYADPPWLYDNQGTRAATSNHYDGLTVDQLCALPVRQLAADDAHLHLWVTNAFLFDAPRIFEAWGFEYRAILVWDKEIMGLGNYWRNSHELMLTAVRGDAKRFNERDMPSVLSCKRGAHSAKPEQVRAMVERASSGPYLEMFGRSPAQGWTVWGNQIERNLFASGAAAG